MSEPPSGTFTFLFTDIEGSARLWEEQPDAMRVALERHDAILRHVIEAHGGVVFKTVGDAFFAVFPVAADALRAAVDAQLRLRHSIPSAAMQQLQLRVRMALHSGPAELRHDDYFGPTLNRIARLLSASYGEQIILSASTVALLGGIHPASVTLRDLGWHVLKDLQQPEQVWQVDHPDLPSRFPPLRSQEAYRTNLPRQITSFVGREQEIRQVRNLLVGTALLTLTGIGGTGKTRLALQTGNVMLDEYPDGVFLVELAAISDPDQVPSAAARALRLREEQGRTLLQTVMEFLKPRQLLLILDNCEHLLNECASLAGTLLASCRRLQILATSRETLGVAGEHTYPVPSLALPRQVDTASPEQLGSYEAVRLFADRAAAAQPGFGLTQEHARLTAHICLRLDGIPLAIELAAARVRSLSMAEILQRLSHDFRLLTGGSRVALPRQQTLKATIDWSYNLLTDGERLLLERLAVFSGGWTLDAAEKVCCDELVGQEVYPDRGITRLPTQPYPIPADAILDLLSNLVEKSLVAYASGSGRYHLLETMRQYAQEKLAARPEGEFVRFRHLDYSLALAEEAEENLDGPDQRQWLDRLEVEHENLLRSLDWSRTDGSAGGLRMVGALREFWQVRGYWSEGRAWCSEILNQPGNSGRTRDRARALRTASVLASSMGDYAHARPLLQEALEIDREINDRWGIASSLTDLGADALWILKDYPRAQEYYEQALPIHREIGNRAGEAWNLLTLGFVFSSQGDLARAWEYTQHALGINREIGNRKGEAWNLYALGAIESARASYPEARKFLEQALVLIRESGDRRAHTMILAEVARLETLLRNYPGARLYWEQVRAFYRETGLRLAEAESVRELALVALAEGDSAAARLLLRESMSMGQGIADLAWVVQSIESFACLAAASGQPASAAALFGAAAALRDRLATSSPTVSAAPSRGEDPCLSEVRTALGDDAFCTAWDRGQGMTIEQALELAMQV